MKKLYKKGDIEEIFFIKKRMAIFTAILLFALVLSNFVMTEAASVNCKNLCKTALKATGNSDKLKYQSQDEHDFAGFSISQYKKVSSIMYIFDSKEVYSLCVVKAKSTSNAVSLQKSMKSYKSNNCNSDYLGDYSPEEQKVLKNAVYGRKGKYVWYIAMSSAKSVNEKAQAKMIKDLKAKNRG